MSTTIQGLEEEIQQLSKTLDILDSNDEERPAIIDRIAQLNGRISELKVKQFLESINQEE